MAINLFSLLTDDLKLDKSSFAGQVIVVTGAGRGIGMQVARAFAFLGGKVILAELFETGREAEQQIRAEGGDALFVQTDVSDSEAVSRLASITREHYGAVSVLINNAIYIQEAAVVDMPVDRWDRTIAVNLRGTFLTCREFLPDMIGQHRGTILNLVSTDAMPGLGAYITMSATVVKVSKSSE